jgi:hypothetical protein
VVGAIIDLGNCLDLTTEAGIHAVSESYSVLVEMSHASGKPLPQNSGGTADLLLRRLDCAVIKTLRSIVERRREEDQSVAPIDTVRGLFVEGEPAFPGAGIRSKTHVQIAVVNPACVLGVFRVQDRFLS